MLLDPPLRQRAHQARIVLATVQLPRRVRQETAVRREARRSTRLQQECHVPQATTVLLVALHLLQRAPRGRTVLPTALLPQCALQATTALSTVHLA